MITESIKALLGAELAQQVEVALQGKGKGGADIDLAATNDGSFVPIAEHEQLRGDMDKLQKTTALKLALTDVHDPEDIISRLQLDKLELDERGNLKGDIAELVKPIRESKPYLFKVPPTQGLNLQGAVPGQVGASAGGDLTAQTINEAFGLKGE